MRSMSFAAAAACMLMSSAALAQVSASAKPQAKTRDATRIICRSEESTGSRLSSVKRCMSAADWEAEKQMNREAVERSQLNRAKND